LPFPLSHIGMAPPPHELWIDDLADIVALHELVHVAHIEADKARGGPGNDNHGFFALESPEFFRDHLEARGLTLGLRDQSRLIAYGVLGLPTGKDYNFGAWAGLADDMLPRVAHIDGIAVHPAHRGHQLHLIMIKYRLLAAFERGRDLIYTTAAPANLHSLSNLLLAGFVIVKRRQLFGGHDRFILAWADHRATEGVDTHMVAIEDAGTQERLLAEGFVGAGGENRDGQSYLRFVPRSAFKAPWS